MNEIETIVFVQEVDLEPSSTLLSMKILRVISQFSERLVLIYEFVLIGTTCKIFLYRNRC